VSPAAPQPTAEDTNPAQLTALPAATTLVTLGIMAVARTR
jgi:hypothetical protein